MIFTLGEACLVIWLCIYVLFLLLIKLFLIEMYQRRYLIIKTINESILTFQSLYLLPILISLMISKLTIFMPLPLIPRSIFRLLFIDILQFSNDPLAIGMILIIRFLVDRLSFNINQLLHSSLLWLFQLNESAMSFVIGIFIFESR